MTRNDLSARRPVRFPRRLPVAVDHTMHDRIAAIARERGCGLSEAVREVIAVGLAEIERRNRRTT